MRTASPAYRCRRLPRVLKCPLGSSYGRPISKDGVRFGEKAGIVPISFLKNNDEISGARLASPQLLTWGAEIPPELIASACSLSVADIETRSHPPIIASCGAAFVMVELKDRERLAAAAPRSLRCPGRAASEHRSA